MTILREDLDAGKIIFTDSDIDPNGEKITLQPGDMLKHEFMEPLGLTSYRLASDIAVPETRIAAIVKGRRAISADTALRLGRYFGNTPEFWINLQGRYDLEKIRREYGAEIINEVRVHGC